MTTVAYDYLNQLIVSSLVILPLESDSFFYPTVLNHTGFAADGTRYTNGIQDAGPVYASWYTEYGVDTTYRGSKPTFPSYSLVLLSKAALTIMDETQRSLPLWMQFVLADNYALANNFNSTLIGFTPTDLSYGGGVLSVIYAPDAGAMAITSKMVVNIDFAQDSVYLDVAI